MEADLDIRPSPIAGRWYPGEARRLASSVDRYLAAAQLPEITGEIVAVMAPHAGHLYSGPVAGYAFGALRGRQPEVVAVVAPMHHPDPAPLLTCAHAAYLTPLGPVLIDREAVNALSDHLLAELGYGLTPIRGDLEHSLEIELPFLQRALSGDFRLIPVMLRDQTVRAARALGRALARVLQGRDAILVASTDLSHFFPLAEAQALDAELLRQVEAFDPLGVMRVEEEGRGFACGHSALAAVLWAAQELGANAVRVLCYATSGDVTGDYTQVVGYAAAAILRLKK
jgi:AmmeMemoRadiSam system protein B